MELTNVLLFKENNFVKNNTLKVANSLHKRFYELNNRRKKEVQRERKRERETERERESE